MTSYVFPRFLFLIPAEKAIYDVSKFYSYFYSLSNKNIQGLIFKNIDNENIIIQNHINQNKYKNISLINKQPRF